MISIIICCRAADIQEALKQNIAATIGCDYEFVVTDNSKNDYTIFTAYNEGVRRAKGDILCFMHDDIVFHAQEWGKIVADALTDKSIGCVGVVGSWFMPNKAASWWLCHAGVGKVIQGYRDDKGKYKTFVDGESPIKPITDVVVVDGCWFCIPKEMFKDIRFDEQTYNSFHCYDIDICMQVRNSGKRVVVQSDIEIEHTSLGNVLTSYYEQLGLFYDKWKNELPCSVGLSLPNEAQEWVSEILSGYQKSVRKNVKFENTRWYKLKKWIKGLV